MDTDKGKEKYGREEMLELNRPSPALDLPVELQTEEGPVCSGVFSHPLGPCLQPKRSKHPVCSLSPCSVREPLHFPCALLLSRAASADPFAQILLEHGELQGELVLIQPFTRPLERVWYWEDGKGDCAGPLSAVDMFNWSLGGWLERKVRVTWSGKDAFVPLEDLIEWQRSLERDRISAFQPH